MRELVQIRAQGEPLPRAAGEEEGEEAYEEEEEGEEGSPAASPVSPEATNFRAPISNFLEKTSREVEKKGVPRWDEGARKPRGNHAELD